MRSEWPKYRWSVAAVCVLLLLDCAFSLLAYLSLHRYSLSSSAVSWSAFSSFRSDALDTVFTCLLRLALLAAVFVLCLLYATPDYDTALEEKRRQARLHNRRLSRRKEVGDDGRSSTAHSDHEERSVSVSINGGSKYEPLLPSTAAQSSPSASDAAVPVALPTSLSQTEKHAINQRCSRYRVAGYVFIFVLCTAMQVSIGVKVVSFDFPAGVPEWPIALFLALPILFINVEQHYCSRIIGKMTREEGHSRHSLDSARLACLLLPPRFLCRELTRVVGCAVLVWQAICSRSCILTSCTSTSRRTGTAATSAGSASRRATGARHATSTCVTCASLASLACAVRESSAETRASKRRWKSPAARSIPATARVTSPLYAASHCVIPSSHSSLPDRFLLSQYLLRALKLARPHCGLILLALVCLLMNAAAQLFAPNLQGSLALSLAPTLHPHSYERVAWMSCVRAHTQLLLRVRPPVCCV